MSAYMHQYRKINVKLFFFPKNMIDLAACALFTIIIIEKIMKRLKVLIRINIVKNVKIIFFRNECLYAPISQINVKLFFFPKNMIDLAACALFTIIIIEKNHKTHKSAHTHQYRKKM